MFPWPIALGILSHEPRKNGYVINIVIIFNMNNVVKNGDWTEKDGAGYEIGI